MVAYLGDRTKQAALDPNNVFGPGLWTVTFMPVDLVQVHAQIHHIAVSGPSGSAFQIFLDTKFYDYVARGDINSWDPSQTMPVNPGQTIYFYWNSSELPKPTVSLYLQQTPSI